MSRIGVCGVVVCALLAACGAQEGRVGGAPIEPAPLSERELAWVRAYSAWAIAFWDEGFQPRPGAGIRRVCLERLDEAGQAPTARLRSADVGARRVCSYLASGSVNDAEDAVEAADESLLPLLLENQRLQVRSGVGTTASHVDLNLSGLASKHSSEAVETRCWSPRDWERVIGESNVWGADDDDHLAIDGIADVDGGRMHLKLEHCNLLVSLGREDVGRRSREGLIAAGVALMTFAHEIEHFAKPEGSEAEVECAAYGLAHPLGRDLMIERTEVDLLVDAYREVIAPTLPNEYRDPDCRAARS